MSRAIEMASNRAHGLQPGPAAFPSLKWRAVPTCVCPYVRLPCLSKMLSLKQKSANPAYNSCSRFH